MRITYTFVLCLWVDTTEPNRLRGTLRPIVDNTDYPFADAQTLLDLLRQMTSYREPPVETANYDETANG